MNTDPIADYLTRLRNASMANHKIVEIPASNLKKDITKILFEKGYILSYKFEDDDKQGVIKIAMKYHPETKLRGIHYPEVLFKKLIKEYGIDKAREITKNRYGYTIGGQ